MSVSPLDLSPVPGQSDSLTTQVAVAIRDAVKSEKLVPGVLYSVYQLADQLGVSRSPVRDALLRLEEVGLVRFERNRGFRIRLPDPHQIAEIFAVRLALELPAVRRVARNHGPSFESSLIKILGSASDAASSDESDTYFRHDQHLHDLILAEAGNQNSREIVQRLRETTRLLGASTAEGLRSLHDIEQEHRPVVDAILGRDPDAASEMMREHLINTGKLLVKQQIDRQSLELDAEAVWATVNDL